MKSNKLHEKSEKQSFLHFFSTSFQGWAFEKHKFLVYRLWKTCVNVEIAFWNWGSGWEQCQFDIAINENCRVEMKRENLRENQRVSQIFICNEFS